MRAHRTCKGLSFLVKRCKIFSCKRLLVLFFPITARALPILRVAVWFGALFQYLNFYSVKHAFANTIATRFFHHSLLVERNLAKIMPAAIGAVTVAHNVHFFTTVNARRCHSFGNNVLFLQLHFVRKSFWRDCPHSSVAPLPKRLDDTKQYPYGHGGEGGRKTKIHI